MASSSNAAASVALPARREVLGWSQSGFHRLSYTEWGEPNAARVVVCVHGLTRNARDFDILAGALAHECRVLCPDVAGRGQSDWLARKEDYSYPQYLADMAVILARATEGRDPAASIDWVGTSMGGMIGTLVAAQTRHPIRRLVVNDIGPFVPKAALQRIGGYVGRALRFADVDAAVTHVRIVSAPFGPLSDAQWRHLTLHNLRQDADGFWVLRYDPGIAENFLRAAEQDISLWSFWDRIDCPVLVLRGADSDVLTADTAREMTQRGPRAELIEFAGIGHAPALMERDQIDVVCRFLGVVPAQE